MKKDISRVKAQRPVLGKLALLRQMRAGGARLDRGLAAFSERIASRVLRRDTRAWRRFSLDYLLDAEEEKRPESEHPAAPGPLSLDVLFQIYAGVEHAAAPAPDAPQAIECLVERRLHVLTQETLAARYDWRRYAPLSPAQAGNAAVRPNALSLGAEERRGGRAQARPAQGAQSLPDSRAQTPVERAQRTALRAEERVLRLERMILGAQGAPSVRPAVPVRTRRGEIPLAAALRRSAGRAEGAILRQEPVPWRAPEGRTPWVGLLSDRPALRRLPLRAGLVGGRKLSAAPQPGPGARELRQKIESIRAFGHEQLVLARDAGEAAARPAHAVGLAAQAEPFRARTAQAERVAETWMRAAGVAMRRADRETGAPGEVRPREAHSAEPEAHVSLHPQEFARRTMARVLRLAGAAGALGASGRRGERGANGRAGVPGTAGLPGTSGSAGTSGANGQPGQPGAAGASSPWSITSVRQGDVYRQSVYRTDLTLVQEAPGESATEGATSVAPAASAPSAYAPLRERTLSERVLEHWTRVLREVGRPGAMGATGRRGERGANGRVGTPGAAGLPGASGPAGTSGANGQPGQPGAAGAAGASSPWSITSVRQGDVYRQSVYRTDLTLVQEESGEPASEGAPSAAPTASAPRAYSPLRERTLSERVLEHWTRVLREVGRPGAVGATGRRGERGANGRLGAPGAAGLPGANGFSGTNGATGRPGQPGAAGAAGASSPWSITSVRQGDVYRQSMYRTDLTLVQEESGEPAPEGALSAAPATFAPSAYSPLRERTLSERVLEHWTKVLREVGRPGAVGATGRRGERGANGRAGAPGAAGLPGADGFSGTSGANGRPGQPGAAGTAGASSPWSITSVRQGDVYRQSVYRTDLTLVQEESGEPAPEGALSAAPAAYATSAPRTYSPLRERTLSKRVLEHWTKVLREAGRPGAVGAAGSRGERGANGRAGIPGAAGLPGTSGPAGTGGATGRPGQPGAAGATGASSPWSITSVRQGDVYRQSVYRTDLTLVQEESSEPATEGAPSAAPTASAPRAYSPHRERTLSERVLEHWTKVLREVGRPGAMGAAGRRGERGANGRTGAPGAAGLPGANGFSGTDGATGRPGQPGAAGASSPWSITSVRQGDVYRQSMYRTDLTLVQEAPGEPTGGAIPARQALEAGVSRGMGRPRTAEGGLRTTLSRALEAVERRERQLRQPTGYVPLRPAMRDMHSRRKPFRTAVEGQAGMTLLVHSREERVERSTLELIAMAGESEGGLRSSILTSPAEIVMFAPPTYMNAYGAPAPRVGNLSWGEQPGSADRNSSRAALDLLRKAQQKFGAPARYRPPEMVLKEQGETTGRLASQSAGQAPSINQEIRARKRVEQKVQTQELSTAEITRIVDRVYRKLEDRIATEYRRRGM